MSIFRENLIYNNDMNFYKEIIKKGKKPKNIPIDYHPIASRLYFKEN